jgi:hypothetical protein
LLPLKRNKKNTHERNVGSESSIGAKYFIC